MKLSKSHGRFVLVALASLLAVIVAPTGCAGARPGPPDSSRGLEIWSIDVEGGAATLIVTPAGESILIDSGSPGERDAGRIVQAARSAGLGAIDHAITTHYHLDHVGGIPGVAAVLPVKNYHDNGLPDPVTTDIRPQDVAAYRAAHGGSARTLHAGEEIALRPAGAVPLRLRVVAGGGQILGGGDPVLAACPRGHEGHPADPSDNGRSLALVLSYGDFDLFCGGDLTWNFEHRLACPERRVGPVDLFLVNHHGLDQSNHPALLEALGPRVAIMNCGAKKGCEPGTVKALKSLPGLEGFYQLHRNVRAGDEGNTIPAHIANEAEDCRGEPIRVHVAPGGKEYRVEVASRGGGESYASR